MRTSAQKFINNFESYKVYILIALFTLFFLLLLVGNLGKVQRTLKSHAETTRTLYTDDIKSAISMWIEERANFLESSAKYISEDGLYEKEKEISRFMKIFSTNKLYFDAVQLLVPDLYFFFDARKSNDYRVSPFYVDKNNVDPLTRNWFLDTKEGMKTTVSIVPVHGYFFEKTINMCTPIVDKELFKGVLCGIIRADSMFEKIEKLQFSHRAYYFISDENGKVLTFFDNNAIKLKNNVKKDDVENTLSHHISQMSENSDREHFELKGDVITLSKLKQFNWYVGVGMNKEGYLHKIAKDTAKESMFLLLYFGLFILIVNSAHEFLRRRTEKKQKEYEFLLTHRSRMREAGELVSGINHQLKQPVNSTLLGISHLLHLYEQKTLDDATLEKYLKVSRESLSLVDKTISVFRNFYRSNEAIGEFVLVESIKNILYILYTDLSRNNITVSVKADGLQEFKVVSIENFIQQVLLVLILNAKDALVEKEKNAAKEIVLALSLEGEKVVIDVCDFGVGVSKEVEKGLFTELKSSKKDHGSGIGLYFAKKLAQEKLNGDIVLVKNSSPTTFRFSFFSHLRQGDN